MYLQKRNHRVCWQHWTSPKNIFVQVSMLPWKHMTTAECSCSATRHVKTYLRSIMATKQSMHLYSYIQRDFDVNFDKVVDDFAEGKKPKMALLLKQSWCIQYLMLADLVKQFHSWFRYSYSLYKVYFWEFQFYCFVVCCTCTLWVYAYQLPWYGVWNILAT